MRLAVVLIVLLLGVQQSWQQWTISTKGCYGRAIGTCINGCTWCAFNPDQSRGFCYDAAVVTGPGGICIELECIIGNMTDNRIIPGCYPQCTSTIPMFGDARWDEGTTSPPLSVVCQDPCQVANGLSSMCSLMPPVLRCSYSGGICRGPATTSPPTTTPLPTTTTPQPSTPTPSTAPPTTTTVATSTSPPSTTPTTQPPISITATSVTTPATTTTTIIVSTSPLATIASTTAGSVACENVSIPFENLTCSSDGTLQSTTPAIVVNQSIIVIDVPIRIIGNFTIDNPKTLTVFQINPNSSSVPITVDDHTALNGTFQVIINGTLFPTRIKIMSVTTVSGGFSSGSIVDSKRRKCYSASAEYDQSTRGVYALLGAPKRCKESALKWILIGTIGFVIVVAVALGFALYQLKQSGKLKSIWRSRAPDELRESQRYVRMEDNQLHQSPYRVSSIYY